ncbi:uncharacterized protein RAG0_06677 [Rhynchosporium agropyri]|uniref:Zn(2)-C6 fungal-type domain-containing protein n=1 Tax=Rhynchosporium agropyri TaxID=914238 RepID=A0A1E1KIE4_9HELO|nr:uncharacterized protein RAG0_06677 [Rhynchosporium agropyri]
MPPGASSPSSSSRATSATSVKRACDACKVRKVRCSRTSPCSNCIAIETSCTFNRLQGTRGPRKLRAKTLQQIAESQRLARDQAPSVEREEDAQWNPVSPAGSNPEASFDPPTPRAPTMRDRQLQSQPPQLVVSPQAAVQSSMPLEHTPTPIATLILHLCVYRLRMFPLWPIVAVEDLMAALQKDSGNMEAYALANSIAAATIVQLKLDPLRNSAEIVTVENMEGEVQRVISMGTMKLTLGRLRVAFFLHVYYENLEAGGSKSLLHLREAITMAHLMKLHKESSYQGLSLDEQQFRKRVVWQLFVTERNVAVLHNLPVCLKFSVAFPLMEYDKEVSILPAFQKLVSLYWIFDRSGAIDLIQDSVLDMSNSQAIDQDRLSLLQKELQEVSIDPRATNDVQVADFFVTRAWMCLLVWRISTRCGVEMQSSESLPFSSDIYPIHVAKELLAVMTHLPTAAIETLGSSMAFKIHDIASSVLDTISNCAGARSSGIVPNQVTPRQIIDQLLGSMSSCHGGNDMLIEKFRNRLSAIDSRLQTTSNGHRNVARTRPSTTNGTQCSQLAGSIPITQIPRFEIPAMDGSSDMPSPTGVDVPPDLSLEPRQHQPNMSFRWEDIAAGPQMDFGVDFNDDGEAATFDNFWRHSIGNNDRPSDQRLGKCPNGFEASEIHKRAKYYGHYV